VTQGRAARQECDVGPRTCPHHNGITLGTGRRRKRIRLTFCSSVCFRSSNDVFIDGVRDSRCVRRNLYGRTRVEISQSAVAGSIGGRSTTGRRGQSGDKKGRKDTDFVKHHNLGTAIWHGRKWNWNRSGNDRFKDPHRWPSPVSGTLQAAMVARRRPSWLSVCADQSDESLTWISKATAADERCLIGVCHGIGTTTCLSPRSAAGRPRWIATPFYGNPTAIFTMRHQSVATFGAP